MFREADENDNNVVELWEHLSYFETHMTPLQLRMMFLAADKDDNKEVTFTGGWQVLFWKIMIPLVSSPTSSDRFHISAAGALSK